MTGIDWIRFLPFAILAVNLWLWSLIETFSDRPWNVARITILLTGYGAITYMASLALHYSWLEIRWPDHYYDALRVLIGMTVIGSPFLARSAWWAYQGWHRRRKETK